MIRVQIADDMLVIRGMLRNIITATGIAEVVALSSDGVEAIADYKQNKPDIVLMDVEMPNMDGLTALENILAYDPNARVMMCSSLTHSGAEATIKALNIGAIDFLPKPGTTPQNLSVKDFSEQLVRKIKAIVAPETSKPIAVIADDDEETNSDIVLRAKPAGFSRPDVIAIGSSTGGLPPMFTLLGELKGALTVPVFITQHMPATFTKIMAQNITERTGLTAYEAEEGMVVEDGVVYVAPGGYHLMIKNEGGQKVCRLSDSPPENYCRPSVEPMFRSLIEAYGKNIVGVILTGMGHDGKDGAREMVSQGNNLILAQDEASSTVWGMPGAVARAGLCHKVLPADELGKYIRQLMGK